MKPGFPNDFLWGAATSAHQVEGNNHNDWTEWEKLGRVRHGDRSRLAAGHYSRFAADLELAKQLGHNAYRFSVEWSRVMPKPEIIDEHELDHYRAVVTKCRALGLEPVVTLWHFTNPIWLSEEDGWRNRKTVDHFARYVSAVVQAIGEHVTYWITINEPTVYSSLSYLEGAWPPNARDPVSAWLVIRNLLAAHRIGSQIIHRHFPQAKVGTANNLSDFVPSRPDHSFDRTLTWFAKYWHNQWWLDGAHDSVNFIGLNYYFHHPLRFRLSGWREWFRPTAPSHLPTNDLGWTIFAPGLKRLLLWLKRYRLPIIITENGVADAEDRIRTNFIIDHVRAIQESIGLGANVRGYLHWSLLDNFEWVEGFTPRFGLIEVDYQTLERKVRPSAFVYKKIIETGVVPDLDTATQI